MDGGRQLDDDEQGIIRGEYRWLDWQGGQANSFPNDVLIYEWMPHQGRDGKESWKETSSNMDSRG